MQIEQKSEGDLLELIVSGALDNESSTHFRAAIDEHIRDGWHRILVHLPGVNYLSSAGIGVLVAMKKRLEQLHGHFGVCELTPDVELILSQTKLLDVLRCDPGLIRAAPAAGETTRSLSSRIAREDELDLQIYTLDKSDSLECRLIGSPKPLFESSYSLDDFCNVEFSEQSFALGLGALGDDLATAGARAGELMAVAGAVTQSTQSHRTLPDYSLSQADFIPRGQLLYGAQCGGGFSHLVRFDPVESEAPAALSTVISRCLKESRCTLAGLVILAESAGLVGTHLRRSPVTEAASVDDRFQFPEIREWLSFSPDRVYARSLTLIVGVVATGASDEMSQSLDDLLRPVDPGGNLRGHFHAAIFPYRPLKKRTLDLRASVRTLFESGAIQDVLHLLCDDRPVFGVGESALLGGACWISPIQHVVTEEAAR